MLLLRSFMRKCFGLTTNSTALNVAPRHSQALSSQLSIQVGHDKAFRRKYERDFSAIPFPGIARGTFLVDGKGGGGGEVGTLYHRLYMNKLLGLSHFARLPDRKSRAHAKYIPVLTPRSFSRLLPHDVGSGATWQHYRQ